MLAGMLAIAGIGLVASFLLGIASKVFYVAVDPMILSIAEALPGANCGACGFAGCSSCAKAIAKGKTSPDAILPGSGAGTPLRRPTPGLPMMGSPTVGQR
jgi:Na+-translocating ferredoxin:NAD+ oxidoreductase RNF subunit RnfB